MKPSSENIVLFTILFPYGKGESFLENEIFFLAKNYDKVFIFPSRSDIDTERIQNLPHNVYIHNDLITNLKLKPKVVLVQNFFWAFRIYITQLFSRDRLLYIKYYRSFLGYLAEDLKKLSPLRAIIKKHKLENALFYDYWFVNTTISLSILKKQKTITKLICRTHGFDLYDDRQFEKVVSFRDFKISQIDYLYTISKEGQKYLFSKTEQKYHHKIKCSYLGIHVVPTPPLEKLNDEVTFVSCARLIDFKRIQHIPQILKSLKAEKIKWIHFGDGAMMEQLKEEVSDLPNHITCDLRGEISNSEIHAFYKNNFIDFFLSISLFEGLPVSIMESQAYGIPTIATLVNGVGEIVTSKTGIPLNKELSLREISDTINSSLITNFDRKTIQKYFSDHFSATTNYNTFIQEIKHCTTNESE